jgi:hypothetical protein
MSIISYLKNNKEIMPAWLENFTIGNRFDIKEFLKNRVVFYPGSGTDGHPVKIFGSAHCAHSFVYADYGLERSVIENELDHNEHSFLGYHTFARLNLTKEDLNAGNWTPHLPAGDIDYGFARGMMKNQYAFVEILERNENLTDEHGPNRLSILFLGADGVATYDAMFCQNNGYSKPPFGVLIQDHGFGGNYTRFDRGGLLERIAENSKRFPQYLLVATNSKAWSGYAKIDEPGDAGGMHSSMRYLWKRSNDDIQSTKSQEDDESNTTNSLSRTKFKNTSSGKKAGNQTKAQPFNPFRPNPGYNPPPKHFLFL